MRILYVALTLPYPPTSGHRLRSWGLVQALAAEGNDVSMVSFTDPGDSAEPDSEIASICKGIQLLPSPRPHASMLRQYLSRGISMLSSAPYGAARYVSPELRNLIVRQLSENAFDLIVCDTVFTLQNIPETVNVPVIMDSDDVPHSILERFQQRAANPVSKFYAWLEANKLRRFENKVTRRTREVWVCSEDDRRFFQEACPDVRFAVLPNIVNTDHYDPTPEQEPTTVLFQAWLDWFPNRDGVEWFVSGVLPELRKRIPAFKFRVAGRGGSPEFKKQFVSMREIQFTGPVRDMKAEVRKAAVCAVPLRIGSGTRFKILEAGAMAKAIVSTTLGAEGLQLTNGIEIRIADEPVAFAQAVAELLADPERRKAMGAAARRAVEERYSLPTLRACVCRSLNSLASSNTAANSADSRS